MTSYELYVPAPGARHDVRPASAIVGEPTEGGMIDTHYEGGGHAANVQTFEEKIEHAAGRRIERYPTIARRAWRAEDLVHVGTVRRDESMRRWVIADIIDEEALRAWVGGDEVLVIGGSPRLRQEVGGLLFGRLPAHEQARLMATHRDITQLCDEAIASATR